MLVKDLLEALRDIDPETPVIIQKDAEGNEYSPLDALTKGYYVAETTWYGQVYDEDWLPEDCCMDEDEWEDMRNSNPCSLILVPVN